MHWCALPPASRARSRRPARVEAPAPMSQADAYDLSRFDMAWTWNARSGSRARPAPAWIVGLLLLGTVLGMGSMGSQLLGNAHLWMTAERVRGEIIDHGEKQGRRGYLPIVRATMGGRTFQLRFGDPTITEPPPVGSTVTVLVPKAGATAARVERAMELFIFPGLYMFLATVFFGVAVALAFDRAHAADRMRPR